MAAMAPILDFSIKMILAIFDLQVTPMLPTKFWVNWPSASEEEAMNSFSRWPPFQVNKPFALEKKGKIDF